MLKTSAEMMADQAAPGKIRKAKPTAAELDLQRDRFGHNNQGAIPHYSRITYLAHAKGYVMARRPGCTPFAISEKLWRSFDYWPGEARGEHLTTPVDADELRSAYAAIVNNARTKTHRGAPVHPQQGKPDGYPDADGGDKPGVNPSDLNCC